MTQVVEKHIEVTEGLRSGKPHISGTRVAVSDVAVWHLRLGQSLEEIAARHDILFAAAYAAIAYYFDHKKEIDQEIEGGRQFYEHTKAANTSLVDHKLQSAGRE
jgi:uncharacterized protein (DUF433 family)